MTYYDYPGEVFPLGPAPKQEVYERSTPDEIVLYVPKTDFEIKFEDETETDVKVVVRRKKGDQSGHKK